MCIVAFSWQLVDELPLCLISNRDEFYQRPTLPLHAWTQSDIFAGKDLHSGGTWMGVTAQGRWAIVTNFRGDDGQPSYPTSRGDLIQQFLSTTQTPIRFAQDLEKQQCDYAGFNLFMGDLNQAVYMSNRGEAPQVLSPGVYVLSNGRLSEAWMKTTHLRKRFTQELLPLVTSADTVVGLQDLVWDLLEDQRQVMPELLPDTGISIEMEQLLSSTFIQSPLYGTRCSNFLCVGTEQIDWLEKCQQGEQQGELKQFDIRIKKSDVL